MGDHHDIPERREHPGDAPPPPEDIPNYRNWQFIDAGGFGKVWLAQETVTEVPRVVKALSKSDRRRADREIAGVRNYQQSAKSHPSLLQILAVGETPVHYYCVMQPADNAAEDGTYRALTLRTWMRRQGRVAPRAALALIRHIADGVVHLHAHELAHYDLKPENILMVDGRPRIADVSLVRPRDDAPPRAGTTGYIAPSGLANDVYALGKILYELITARPAAQFPSLPNDLLDGRAPLLREAIAICNRACQPDPQRAYASARACRDAMDAALRPPRGLLGRYRRLSPRGKRVAAAIATLLTVAGLWVGDVVHARYVPRLQIAQSIVPLEMSIAEKGSASSIWPVYPVLYHAGKPLPANQVLHERLPAPVRNFCFDFRVRFRRPWSTIEFGLLESLESQIGYHLILRGQPDGDGLYISISAPTILHDAQGEHDPIRGHPQAELTYQVRLARCQKGIALAVWPVNLPTTDPIVRYWPAPPGDFAVGCVVLDQHSLDAHSYGEVSDLVVRGFSAPLRRVDEFAPEAVTAQALPAWRPAPPKGPAPFTELLAAPYHPYDSAAWSTIGSWCWWSGEAPADHGHPKQIRCVPFSTQNRIEQRRHDLYAGLQFLRFDGGLYGDFEAEAHIRLADPRDPGTRAHDPFLSASHDGKVGIAVRLQEAPPEGCVWGGGYVAHVALHPDGSIPSWASIDRLDGIMPCSVDIRAQFQSPSELLAHSSLPHDRVTFFKREGFRLKVRAEGRRIDLYLDDRPMLSATDAAERAFGPGRVALVCESLIPVVESFTVRPVGGTADADAGAARSGP